MEISIFEWKSLNLAIWSGQGGEKLKFLLQNAKMTSPRFEPLTPMLLAQCPYTLSHFRSLNKDGHFDKVFWRKALLLSGHSWTGSFIITHTGDEMFSENVELQIGGFEPTTFALPA